MNGKKLVSLIGIVILVGGLLVGLYLVQTKQIFKPKANVDPASAFQFTDSAGSPLPRTGNTINTSTQNIKINLSDPDALTQP